MKVIVSVQLNGVQLPFEVDTGSPVVLIGESTFHQHFEEEILDSCRPLIGVSGEAVSVLGTFEAVVQRPHQQEFVGKINVVVQACERETGLLGVPALDVLFPGWQRVFENSSKINLLEITDNYCLDDIVGDFGNYVRSNYGVLVDNDFTQPIIGVVVALGLVEGASPIFARARKVPFHTRDLLTAHIQGLVAKGFLKPVQSSQWASPIVVVVKKDGTLRMCIDPKHTLNPYLTSVHYPIPVIDDMLVEINGHEFYSVIDLSGAFQQVQLDEASQRLVTINTHLGLFSYTRMPFGIKTAPTTFQRVMETILKKFKWCYVYIDDIIIVACSVAEMFERLNLVLQALVEANVKIQLAKCEFFRKRVRFVGHVVSKDGIFPSKDKVEAIVQAPAPKDLKELQAFNGLVTYLHKFIPNLSAKLAPILDLLKKDTPFVWGPEQDASFQMIKEDVLSDRFLVHFDPMKQTCICTDASDQGLAAVLCQEVDGMLRPVSFKSRRLTPAEKKYPILHRELLAVVFGTTKFYPFVFGKEIVLYTDHQPLVGLIKAGLQLATVHTRVDRYLLRLNPYDLVPIYKPGKFNVLADFPSRFPVESPMSEEDMEEERLAAQVGCVEDTQRLNYELLCEESRRDSVLVELRKAIEGGFPKRLPQCLRDYSAVKDELVVNGDLVTYQGRVLVPDKLRLGVLMLIHESHLGIVECKLIAKRYFYWPGMVKEVEQVVSECAICRAKNPDRQAKVFQAWCAAEFPFDRVHLDFFFFEDRVFLILVDAFSGWLEVCRMEKTDAPAVELSLRRVFSIFGDPRTIVTDNGPPFTSTEFTGFCEDSDIVLKHSPPYNPSSNGLAERAVQTVKLTMEKVLSKHYSDELLSKLIFDLRNAPGRDGRSPAQKVFSFVPRTQLGKLLPGNRFGGGREGKVALPRAREFVVGEQVFVKGLTKGRVCGQVIRRTGLLTYEVDMGGVVRLVHANQMVRFTGVVPSDDRSVVAEPMFGPRPQRERRPPDRYSS